MLEGVKQNIKTTVNAIYWNQLSEEKKEIGFSKYVQAAHFKLVHTKPSILVAPSIQQSLTPLKERRKCYKQQRTSVEYISIHVRYPCSIACFICNPTCTSLSYTKLSFLCWASGICTRACDRGSTVHFTQLYRSVQSTPGGQAYVIKEMIFVYTCWFFL